MGHPKQKKKRKLMDKWGLKTGGRAGQPKEIREKNGLIGAKNTGRGEPT